jgi:polyphosphate kinase
MIRLTDTPHAPWWIVPSDDKKAARINCITHLWRRSPTKRVAFDAPKLGKRQKRPTDFREDAIARNVVPAVF